MLPQERVSGDVAGESGESNDLVAIVDPVRGVRYSPPEIAEIRRLAIPPDHRVQFPVQGPEAQVAAARVADGIAVFVHVKRYRNRVAPERWKPLDRFLGRIPDIRLPREDLWCDACGIVIGGLRHRIDQTAVRDPRDIVTVTAEGRDE